MSLQVAFTSEAVRASSLDAGYAGLSAALRAGLPVRDMIPIMAVVGAVTWARLFDARLVRQALSVLCLGWIGPTLVALASFPDPGRVVWWAVTLGVVPGVLLVLILRGADELGRRFLRLDPVLPRPVPKDGGRRLVLVLVAGALTLVLLHGALTLALLACRGRALEALRARGEPLAPSPAALAKVAAVYSRTLQRVETALPLDLLELDALAEASRRPRGRPGPHYDRPVRELPEAALELALARGDSERAAAALELRWAQVAAIDPEIVGRWAFSCEAEALTWLVPLLARGEPSPTTCRRLLERVREPPRWRLALGALRGERIQLLDSFDDPSPGPLAAQLGWVRDLDRLHALQSVDEAAEALAAGPVFAAQPDITGLTAAWRPLTHDARIALYDLPYVHARLARARALARAMLELRLHRLESGAYPATFTDLPPGVTYALDGQGGFVLTGTTSGDLLPMKVPR